MGMFLHQRKHYKTALGYKWKFKEGSTTILERVHSSEWKWGTL